MRTLSGDKLGVNQGTCCIWYRYMVGFYIFDDSERRMCEPVKSVLKDCTKSRRNGDGKIATGE